MNPPPKPPDDPYGEANYYAPGYGKRLRSARLSAGLSQAEAIRYTHGIIDKTGLSMAERELREIRMPRLKRLAGLYGVRVYWLISGMGPRMIDDPDDEPITLDGLGRPASRTKPRRG